jgi:hypothetical protein
VLLSLHGGATLRRFATKDAGQPDPEKRPEIGPEKIIPGFISCCRARSGAHDFGMEIGGHRFEHVGDIQPERNDTVLCGNTCRNRNT